MASSYLHFWQFGHRFSTEGSVTVTGMRVLPRTLAAVLSDSTLILGRNWRALASLGLLAFIPAGVLTLIVFRYYDAGAFLELVLNQPSLEAIPPDVLRELAGPFIRASVIALLIQGVASVYVLLGCHRVVVSDVAETSTGTGEATRFALANLLPGLAAVLVAAIPVAAALVFGLSAWLQPTGSGGGSSPIVSLVGLLLLIAFLAPGLWLLASFSMTTNALAVESPGILGALTRSWNLVRGRRMQTLGLLFLVGFLGIVAAELIQLVAVPIALVGPGNAPRFIASVLGIAFQGMIVAAIGVPLTLWYIDLRARSEQLLSENLI